MILGKDGKPVGPMPKSPANEAPKQEAKDAKTEQEDMLNKPLLGIDKLGNLTLYIPLTKTSEVFARGMVDMARTQLLTWYSRQANAQREVAQLAAKTGFQRFKDKLMGRA